MDAKAGSRVFRLADFSGCGAFGLVIVGPVSRLSLFRPVLGKRRPRREEEEALVRLGWESEGVGYPGLSLAAVRRTRSWYGAGAGEMEADAAGVAYDDGADLQEA